MQGYVSISLLLGLFLIALLLWLDKKQYKLGMICIYGVDTCVFSLLVASVYNKVVNGRFIAGVDKRVCVIALIEAVISFCFLLFKFRVVNKSYSIKAVSDEEGIVAYGCSHKDALGNYLAIQKCPYTFSEVNAKFIQKAFQSGMVTKGEEVAGLTDYIVTEVNAKYAIYAVKKFHINVNEA